MNPQQRVAQRLLRYGHSRRRGSYTENKAADKLVASNPTAFLLGVLFDQGIPYEEACQATDV